MSDKAPAPSGRRNAVLDAINRILQSAIACSTEAELGRACLSVAERLTASLFGFVAELNGKGGLDTIAVSDPGWEACRMDEKTGHGTVLLNMKVRGMYGRVLLDEKGFFTNDPSSHPDSAKTPAGHPALTAFLGVPLKRQGKTTAVMGLANRKGGYTEENLRDAEALAPVIMETLMRKRAEVALRLSREDLDRAQAVAHTGSWRLDVKQNELLWSDENHRIFGLPKGTPMSYETFLGIVHPDDREYVDRMWKAGLRGEPYDIEHRIEADGRIKWVREKAELELDRDGALLGGFGTTQDVTERKLAEQALREAKESLEKRVKERTRELEISMDSLEAEINDRIRAEELARAGREQLYDVLETLPAYVILLSPDHHVPFANRVFRERFGESGGRKCFEFLFKRDQPCENCRTYDALRNNAPLNWEWTGPDGRDYDIYDYPFTDIDRSPLILEMGIDVTVRKKAQEELRGVKENLERQVLERTGELAESEKKYRAAFEASVNQLVLIRAARDESGAVTGWRYVDVNDNALRAMGLKREQLVGKAAHEVIPGRVEKMKELWSRVLDTGKHLEYETAFQDRDYLVSVFRMDPETVVSSSVDITDRKRAEVALRKALERNSQQEKLAAIGRLAGGVAHEIRNPLSAMKSAVYYLKLALEKPDPNVADTLALLDREIARSETVISSLLGLAHPSRQSRADADINSLVREALGERPPAGVEVQAELEEAIPSVRADPAQLAIIFGNLIRNAYEAMPGGGRLTVASRHEGAWVSISITDTGTGIPKDDLRRIFEPLMTTKEGGTGLGLPMAKVLAEGHGGSIEVESEPGTGSTFTVKLPVKKTSRPGE